MQVISLLLGLVYLQQSYDQEGVMNINGCLFLMQTQMSAANVVAVVNVSFTSWLFRVYKNISVHINRVSCSCNVMHKRA